MGARGWLLLAPKVEEISGEIEGFKRDGAEDDLCSVQQRQDRVRLLDGREGVAYQEVCSLRDCLCDVPETVEAKALGAAVLSR